MLKVTCLFFILLGIWAVSGDNAQPAAAVPVQASANLKAITSTAKAVKPIQAEPINSTITTPPTAAPKTAAPTTAAPTTAAPTTDAPPTAAPTTAASPTAAPKTTPGPSNTTTPVPSSSTPAPAPPKPADTWQVKDPKTNVTCILAKMIVVIEAVANKTNNATKISPETSSGEGACGNKTESLNISWPSALNDTNMSSLSLDFGRTDTTYYVQSLSLNLYLNTTKGVVMMNYTTSNVTLFNTTLQGSYACSSLEPLKFIDPLANVSLKMTELHLEAFRTTNTSNFADAHYCASGEVPDMVPIVVGLSLAGLVVIVVIAYMVGRRRSQARGYLSM